MYRALGIPMKTNLYEIPSTFESSRRPVFLISDKKLMNFSSKSGGLYDYESASGKDSFVSSLMLLVNSIRVGLFKSTGENVNILVHTNSFKISRIIAENGVYDHEKFIFHSENGTSFYENVDGNVWTYDKESFMLKVKESPNMGMTFISPSITEGVDFKNGLARAQIILKHPMPGISNHIKALQGRLGIKGIVKDYDIYNRKTYTTLLQQYGRVMRNEDDWGATFIVDQKGVEAIAKIIVNKKERKRANIDYMISAIKHAEKPSGIILGRPSFKLEY